MIDKKLNHSVRNDFTGLEMAAFIVCNPINIAVSKATMPIDSTKGNEDTFIL